MLTALEVHGFKSFADRTRFDFPPGITVIVGPNGSGKSNVVDAIKWVLGSQSAKSLRGSEMTDVIFKGSAGGRKPLNTAEATIVFDNRDNRLPIEEQEVRVTRRVYRSGESEYLLNGQPVRLRDIKDLFRGTGVGADAYSLIEQGKVASLLQASAKDRRAIFEEAAGISRFKAKKVETERRLARVDQNMLRLRDIVDEVESRLRQVRSQATKARKYKEYSDRLQQLRTQVGMTDWRQMSQRLAQIESDLAELSVKSTAAKEECQVWDRQIQSAEAELAEVDALLRNAESRSAASREQIAAGQSTIDHLRARCLEVEDELSRARKQLAAMHHRTGNLDELFRETTEAVETAAADFARLCEKVYEIEHEAGLLAERLNAAQERDAMRREQHLVLVQQGVDLANQIHAARGELENAAATAERCRLQADDLAAQLDELVTTIATVEGEERSLAFNLQEQSRLVQSAEEDLARSQRRLDKFRDRLVDLRDQRVRLEERATLLEDLERRQEGVQAGVQEVLGLANSENPGPYADVCGMVADLIDVHVEAAAVVEAALGSMAQCVVVQGEALMDYVHEPGNRPSGRVAFVPLEDAPLSIETSWLALEQQPGVIARADRFVQAELLYQPLLRRLLGNTWIVESLPIARQLASVAGDQLRFVTLDGAVLEANGTLILDAARQATGLISRRAELRQLDERLRSLADETEEVRRCATQVEGEMAEIREQAQELTLLHRQLSDDLANQRAQVQSSHKQRDRVAHQLSAAQAKLHAAMHRHETVQLQIGPLVSAKDDADREAAILHDELQRSSQLIRQLEAQHKACDLRATTAKIEAAKSEERLDALRASLRQLQREKTERQRALDEVHAQITRAELRRGEVELSILNATSRLAELFLERQQQAEELQAAVSKRAAASRQRNELAKQVDRRRREVHKFEDEMHKLQLADGQLRGERDHLAERLREDYGIELANAEQPVTEEQQLERTAVEEEILDLRRKINNIGAVNMDALAEIEDLERRFNTLSTQYDDLKEAKAALEKIIHRINADSRRLFTETLEVIRTNFQALYRKLFGGGHADIVLEQGVDILEAGIEIVANPPGKPAFSNSLLSGGEQGMTAVSLLLAIFQHRPSPFCVLDEVDAPLDESNIGRFVETLREFLTWTKFVIVTHSKKTMTAADTLYGVTMQEPNVSKRVSVRFEDVSDHGEISAEAVEKQQAVDATKEEDERGAA
jgi:chromosome segregation protein